MVAHTPVNPADHGGLVGYVMHPYRRRKAFGTDLDELRQELWVDLYEAAARYDPEGHPGTTFAAYSIACLTGQAATYFANETPGRPRRLRVGKSRPAGVGLASQMRQANDGGEGDYDPVTYYARSPDHAVLLEAEEELACNVRSLLAILKGHDPEVYRLHVAGGHTVPEIADRVGISPSQVNTAIKRIREAARQVFGDRCPPRNGSDGAKFTPAECDRIRQCRAEGQTYNQIARRYGVDHHTIRSVCLGVSRKTGKPRSDADRASTKFNPIAG
jgi:RNA polymerase sigma factor (sigma-70 family)